MGIQRIRSRYESERGHLRTRRTRGMAKKDAKRVAIVAGLRTPFAKQWTAYREVSALRLGQIVVAELLQRAALDPNEVKQVVYGQVLPSIEAPNIAREIVTGTGMPKGIEAFSV